MASSSVSSTPLPPPSGPGTSNASSSLPPPPAPPQHKRVYQACIPCRRRKVKCDLGSVDNPGDPPCVRCRRESKECFFSATRRKRRVNEENAPGYEDDYNDDYVLRNGRKRQHVGSSESGDETPPPLRQHSSEPGLSSARTGSASYGDARALMSPQPPLTPGGHMGRSAPLRRPQSPSPSYANSGGAYPPYRSKASTDDANIRVENPEAQDVMRREVYGPHDALDLLYKAATDRYASNLYHFSLKFG
jgi:hypothetical protein